MHTLHKDTQTHNNKVLENYWNQVSNRGARSQQRTVAVALDLHCFSFLCSQVVHLVFRCSAKYY